jgi:hypothetical protein
MTNLLQDLRFALRQMRRSPGFSATAVFTLALGIAATVIVFSVLQAVLRPIDVPHGDRVMTLARTDQDYPIFSYPEVRDVRDMNTVFSGVAAINIDNFGLEANGVSRPVWGYKVSGQYFEVVGIKPFLGRLLQPADDDHRGASQAVVLAWPAWKSNFGADPNIVGKTIRLNKHPYTVVGVTPEGFYGTEKFGYPDFFIPMSSAASLDGTDWLDSRSNPQVYSIVRIKDGVTMPQVQADLNMIVARLRQQYPKEGEKLTLKLTRPGLMGDFFGKPARAFLGGCWGWLVLCCWPPALTSAACSRRVRPTAHARLPSAWRLVRTAGASSASSWSKPLQFRSVGVHSPAV